MALLLKRSENFPGFFWTTFFLSGVFITGLAFLAPKAEGVDLQDTPPQSDYFCEGLIARMPGATIWVHVFSNPKIVLVELVELVEAQNHRQTVLINAEAYGRQTIPRSSEETTELVRLNFNGGSLQFAAHEKKQSTRAILTLTGAAALDLGPGHPDSITVDVHCRALLDEEP